MLYVMCLCDTVVIKWCNMENGVMWLTKVMVELMSAELQHVYCIPFRLFNAPLLSYDWLEECKTGHPLGSVITSSEENFLVFVHTEMTNAKCDQISQ